MIHRQQRSQVTHSSTRLHGKDSDCHWVHFCYLDTPQPAPGLATMTLDPSSFTSPEGTYVYQPGLFPPTYLIPPINSSSSSGMNSSAMAMPGVPISLSLGMGMGMGMAMTSGSVGGGGFITSPNQLATSPTAATNTNNQLMLNAQQLAQAGGGGAVAGGTGSPGGTGGMGGTAAALPAQTVFGNQLPVHPMRATHVEMPMWGMMDQQAAVGPPGGSSQGKGNGLGFLSRGNKTQQQQSTPATTTSALTDGSSSLHMPASYEPSAHSSSEASGTGGTLAERRRSDDDDDYGMSPPPPPMMGASYNASSERRGGLGGLGLGGFSKGSKQQQQSGAFGPGASGTLPPRPKNNLRATNSTFITRVQMHDRFTSMIQHPPQADPTWSLLPPRPAPGSGGNASRLPPTQRWVFLNVHRTLVWCTIDPTGKCRDALMRLHFSSSPTAHAASEATKQAPGPNGAGSNERLDLVVGFASGDLLWMDPILGKYTRLNKGGVIDNTPVVQIRFHPTNPSLVYVTHADGLMFIYALDRDDPPPSVATSVAPWLRFFDRQPASRRGTTDSAAALSDFGPQSSRKPSHGSEMEAPLAQQAMQTWRNEEVPTGKSSTTSPWALKNPIAVWRMPMKRMKRESRLGIEQAVIFPADHCVCSVSEFEFSPDGQLMATVSEDGCMRLIDVANERLTDVYAGYFGGLNCVGAVPYAHLVQASH